MRKARVLLAVLAIPTFAQQPDPLPLRNWPIPRTKPDSATITPSLIFVAITPCRLLDTRSTGGSGNTGAFGPPSLTAYQDRIILVPLSPCGVPFATAYSLNFVSITPLGQSVGYVSAWQDNQPWPGTVILNALEGGVVGNSAIVLAGQDGGIQVMANNNTDLVIDINGYYAQASSGLAGPQGPTGLQGPIGPAGPPGSQGPAGAAGPAGPAGSAAHFRGAWSSSTAYILGDAASFISSSYIATAGNTNIQPDTDVLASGGHWALLAAAGANGAPGSNGAPGVPGAPGAQGPAGAAGSNGAQGPSGPGPMSLSGVGIGTNGSAPLTTVAGGVSGTVTVLPISGFLGAPVSATANGGFIQFPGTTSAGIIQTLPVGYTFTQMAGTIENETLMNLTGTTVTITAKLYKYTTAQGFASPVAGASCIFAPGFTGGNVAVGAAANCSAAISATYAAGDGAVLVVSATATGTTLINTLSLDISIGLQ